MAAEETRMCGRKTHTSIPSGSSVLAKVLNQLSTSTGENVRAARAVQYPSVLSHRYAAAALKVAISIMRRSIVAQPYTPNSPPSSKAVDRVFRGARE